MKTRFYKVKLLIWDNKPIETNITESVLHILTGRNVAVTVLDTFDIIDFWDAEYIEDKEYNATNIKIKKGVIKADIHFSYADNMLLTCRQLAQRSKVMDGWAYKEYYDLGCGDDPKSSFVTMLRNKNIV